MRIFFSKVSFDFTFLSYIFIFFFFRIRLQLSISIFFHLYEFPTHSTSFSLYLLLILLYRSTAFLFGFCVSLVISPSFSRYENNNDHKSPLVLLKRSSRVFLFHLCPSAAFFSSSWHLFHFVPFAVSLFLANYKPKASTGYRLGQFRMHKNHRRRIFFNNVYHPYRTSSISISLWSLFTITGERVKNFFFDGVPSTERSTWVGKGRWVLWDELFT